MPLPLRKKVAMAVVAVLAVLLLATLGAAWYMLDYALAPPADARDMAGRYSRMYSGILTCAIGWTACGRPMRCATPS